MREIATVAISKEAHLKAKVLAAKQGVKLFDCLTDLVLAGLDVARKKQKGRAGTNAPEEGEP